MKPPRLAALDLLFLPNIPKNRGQVSDVVFQVQLRSRPPLMGVPCDSGQKVPRRVLVGASLIFFSFFLQGRSPKKTKIFLTDEPSKSLGKKGKLFQKARKSLQKKDARKSTKAKENQGWLGVPQKVLRRVFFGALGFLMPKSTPRGTPSRVPKALQKHS